MSQPSLPPLPADLERTLLRPLARQFPNRDAVLAEVIRLSAELTLPSGVVHVISDVHGADVKLRHVINNASGTLRPLVQQLFGERLPADELQELLALVFYPRETLSRLRPTLTEPERLREFCRRRLGQLFEIVRTLAPWHSRPHVLRIFPREFRGLLDEVLNRDGLRGPDYHAAMIDAIIGHGRALHLMHLTVRVVRNLMIDELVIAGDCWDRGPRGDRVVEYLTRQPHVSFIWGNHDAAWLGACLGQPACVAHVLRISLRYGRTAQLVAGYGIELGPLEELARTIYGDDPAACFRPKGPPRPDADLLARMQKAAALMQFKLEGQTIERHPEWGLDHRRLLHRIDIEAGTVEIDGVKRTLRDRHFPTLDLQRPYDLSPAEQTCLEAMSRAFYDSERLWEQMKWLLGRGSMWLVRDDHLIFHGCVPVDDGGQFLPLKIEGTFYAGRALFEALDGVLARIRESSPMALRDLLWYLWCGPRSPLFGKDRIATFEIDLVVEEETHVETKNPYFRLINEGEFCDRVLREFDVDTARGLIVNGHVPVKIEKGESPLKKSGKAITIDGAFSEAYGDHGYTLILEPEQTQLARHHHFESVDAAVEKGIDIIPTMTQVRRWQPPRRVADNERGAEIRRQIELLERLAAAYRSNRLPQHDDRRM